MNTTKQPLLAPLSLPFGEVIFVHPPAIDTIKFLRDIPDAVLELVDDETAELCKHYFKFAPRDVDYETLDVDTASELLIGGIYTALCNQRKANGSSSNAAASYSWPRQIRNSFHMTRNLTAPSTSKGQSPESEDNGYQIARVELFRRFKNTVTIDQRHFARNECVLSGQINQHGVRQSVLSFTILDRFQVYIQSEPFLRHSPSQDDKSLLGTCTLFGEKKHFSFQMSYDWMQFNSGLQFLGRSSLKAEILAGLNKGFSFLNADIRNQLLDNIEFDTERPVDHEAV